MSTPASERVTHLTELHTILHGIDECLRGLCAQPDLSQHLDEIAVLPTLLVPAAELATRIHRRLLSS